MENSSHRKKRQNTRKVISKLSKYIVYQVYSIHFSMSTRDCYLDKLLILLGRLHLDRASDSERI